MDKRPFDFKDLMAFGMFASCIADIRFYAFKSSAVCIEKPPLITLTGLGWHFYDLPYQVNPLWAVVPFCIYNIAYLRVMFNNIIV